jgi:hypothetical protein
MLPNGDSTDVIKELEFWFRRFVKLLVDAIETISNLLFRVLTDQGGFGQAMRVLIDAMCYLINLLLGIWNMIWCPLLRDTVGPGLQALEGGISSVVKILGLADAFRPALSAMRAVHTTLSGMDCTRTMKCTSMDHPIPEEAIGVLPVTSRCWAGTSILHPSKIPPSVK